MLAAASHAVVVAGLVALRQRHRDSAALASGLFLLTAVHLAEYGLDVSGTTLAFPHVYGVGAAIPFLIGPMLYLYLRLATDPGRGLHRTELLHGAPALACLVWLLPFYAAPAAVKRQLLADFLRPEGMVMAPGQAAMVVVNMLLLAAYAVAATRVVSRVAARLPDSRSSEPALRRVACLRSVVIGFGVFVTAYALALPLLLGAGRYGLGADYAVMLLLATFLLATGYLLVLEPDLSVRAAPPTTDTFQLDDAILARLRERLLDHMDAARPYLKEDLRLADLADAVGAPEHHVTEVLNRSIGKNFYEFVNGYRVREAQRALASADPGDRTILEIAFESGFASKPSFNRVFKRHTGMTPSAWRRAHSGSSVPERA